jgi:hypothetical protein
MKSLLSQLKTLAQRLPEQLTKADKAKLEDIYQQCLSTIDEPEAMFGYVLTKAMRKHISGFASFNSQEMNGAVLRTDLPERYAVVFKEEEITNVYWAKP